MTRLGLLLVLLLCCAWPRSVAAAEALTSVRYKTFIWAKPQKDGRFLGYMRVGQRVKLRHPDPVKGQGCPKGFFRVEPRGYVCHDDTVTLEDTTPFLEANRHTLPSEGPHPYHFAISNGAPMYSRLPSADEQKKTEWRYGKAGTFAKLPLFSRGHEQLATTDPIAPTHEIPPFLASGQTARGVMLPLLRRTIPHGAMLAYTEAFDVGGRTFLLSTDLTVVPADRVRRFERSQFRGVKLGGEVTLPIAWFREKERPVYALADGVAKRTGAMYPVRSWVALSDERQVVDGRTFLQAKDGRWLDAADATIAQDYGKRPFRVEEGDKWIIASISAGTLIAYEDLTPVFVTLMSPGLGGIPRPGGDHVKDSTTPLGVWRITFKDRAATMSPEFGEDRSFWIADVPFTQYFNPPFALHTAYWHEKFGELMSGGCINVSPLDGEYLFGWTGPHVPDGWQGATGAAAKENGEASWIVVTR